MDLCVKHQECSSGQSVLLTGSAYSDTVCGTCESLANGGMLLMLSAKNKIFFNATKFTKLFQTFSGETLRTFLSGFFHAHRMRVGKIKKFVSKWAHSLFVWLFSSTPSPLNSKKMPIKPLSPCNRYILTSSKERCSLPKQREPLMDHIIDWLAKAPEEKLRKIPDMLTASDLNSMAEKLKKRLHEIKQQNPNCSLTIDEVNNAL